MNSATWEVLFFPNRGPVIMVNQRVVKARVVTKDFSSSSKSRFFFLFRTGLSLGKKVTQKSTKKISKKRQTEDRKINSIIREITRSRRLSRGKTTLRIERETGSKLLIHTKEPCYVLNSFKFQTRMCIWQNILSHQKAALRRQFFDSANSSELVVVNIPFWEIE